MAANDSKTRVMERFRMERRRLEQNLAKLSPEDMTCPGVVGEWSTKDVLAHLYEWEAMCLEWIAATRRGENPAVPAPGVSWKNLDPLNRQIYEKHKDEPLESVLESFRGVHARFEEVLEGMSEVEMMQPGTFPWMGRNPFAAWVNGFAAHDLWGKTKILKWKRTRT